MPSEGWTVSHVAPESGWWWLSSGRGSSLAVGAAFPSGGPEGGRGSKCPRCWAWGQAMPASLTLIWSTELLLEAASVVKTSSQGDPAQL